MNNQASKLSVGVAVTLMITAISGGMYMGALASDVEQLQKEQTVAKEDHDRLITVETTQTLIKRDVTEVKKDVKAILAAINAMEKDD